jgi:hypothetical protein
MKQSTLYVRNAGFGDMLKQVNSFFHLADAFGFDPRVFIPENNQRNSLGNHDFFHQLGFKSIMAPKPAIARKKATSLSMIDSDISDTYAFDLGCYNNPDIKRALGDRDKESHPKLRRLARNGRLFEEISIHKTGAGGIAVHVRRGDVSQIEANDFPDIFDMAVAADKILHRRGVFTPSTLQTDVPWSDRRRFVDTPTHLNVLNQVKQDVGTSSHILVSDGFTKLAERLVEDNRDLLIDKTMTAQALEQALGKELRPLLNGATKVILGETDHAFYETLRVTLGADVIISASPGFLRQLARLFDLDIRFVDPKPRPEPTAKN